MAAVQFTRQEVVDMLRRAGLREAADEALRDLSDPIDLDRVQEWARSAVLPETISSAGWAAAHEAPGEQPSRAAATPFTGKTEAPGTMMEVQVERDLVFAVPDGSGLALDIYRAPQNHAPRSQVQILYRPQVTATVRKN